MFCNSPTAASVEASLAAGEDAHHSAQGAGELVGESWPLGRAAGDAQTGAPRVWVGGWVGRGGGGTFILTTSSLHGGGRASLGPPLPSKRPGVRSAGPRRA